MGVAWLTQLEVDSSYATHVLPALIVLSLGFGFGYVALASPALIGVDHRDAA